MTDYNYFYYDSALQGEDCDALVSQYKDHSFAKGKVEMSGEFGLDENRKASIAWIEQNSFIARAVYSYIQQANQHFRIPLANTHEPAQLTKYSKTGDVYGWHKDDIPAMNRSLSAVAQLSKPEDYTGSEFQLFNGEHEPENLPIKNQGSIIVFRSYEWHRVTELLSGERYSLVFWGHSI